MIKKIVNDRNKKNRDIDIEKDAIKVRQ